MNQNNLVTIRIREDLQVEEVVTEAVEADTVEELEVEQGDME